MNVEIPQQTTGAHTNTTHSINANNISEARFIYNRACKRLLNINSWHKLCGTASADFELVDSEGNKDFGLAKENEYFKIDIPGLGTIAGDGYDWVIVEKIEDHSNPDGEEENLLIKVRPTTSPTNNSSNTAHFLSDEATSTFVISRNTTTVSAAVYGRNEVPNKNTEKIVDKIRNIIVGTGAIAGASKIQWKLLVKGLLAGDNKE